MPKKLPPPEGPVRYTYATAVAEIERYLARPTTPVNMRKRMEKACNMDHSQFSHRMSEYRGERFTEEHFGAVCHEANGPTGWPYLRWEDAAERDRVWNDYLATAKGRRATQNA